MGAVFQVLWTKLSSVFDTALDIFVKNSCQISLGNQYRVLIIIWFLLFSVNKFKNRNLWETVGVTVSSLLLIIFSQHPVNRDVGKPVDFCMQVSLVTLIDKVI